MIIAFNIYIKNANNKKRCGFDIPVKKCNKSI